MNSKLNEHLKYLRANLDDLREICTPQWHPLGFVSCIIHNQAKERVARLHYWPANERRTKNPDWPIHTHVYTLSSLILSGFVRDIQYSRIDGCTYTAYEVTYHDGGSQITRTDRELGLKIEIDELRKPGETYFVERGVFHQSEVALGKSAITLVTLTNHMDIPPLVLGESEEGKYPYERTSYDSNVFWTEIEKCI